MNIDVMTLKLGYITNSMENTIKSLQLIPHISKTPFYIQDTRD
jgi:hypothetical protein